MCCSVNVSICLVCYVFVKRLVKQFAICLGVVAMLLFNPVAPYGYLLPNVYFIMADIENPYSFVCVCRFWICLDITRFYEEAPAIQLVRMAGLPQKTVNQDPIFGAGRVGHNLHSRL